MVRIPTHRKPTHPGEMLLEEFITPMGITQRVLSTAIVMVTALQGIPSPAVNIKA